MRLFGLTAKIIAVLCFGMAALPARATPPDVLTLHDTLFGVSDTHVFLLRTTEDNMGRYIPGLSDIYLVAKNAQTGKDETLWPVTRTMRDSRENTLTGKTENVLVQYSMEGRVNPYAILAEEGGRPVPPTLDRPEFNSKVELTDALVIGGERPVRLEGDALIAQLYGAINKTAASLVEYPGGGDARLAPVTARELLEDPSYTLENCAVEGLANVSRTDDDPTFRLALLRCEDEMDHVTLFVVIPPKN